ncbi:MAG: terpene cyclase/mutase family protein [Planctomycetota bacterium]|jgi:squalene-hopene/tetraprenyl-beta-curcumene cyclase|nr:terpene cyclase/mutase family protein [Planctomycetota bacterium]MDA1200834.1 terpene cyclase/mutase family protein [Planctomycetota bacterium]
MTTTRGVLFSLSALLLPTSAPAEDAAVAKAIGRASAFLAEAQADDGSFKADLGPAVTGLAVTALVRSGTPAEDPVVQKGLDYLLTFRQPDGGIYSPGAPVANYETSIAMLALAACNAEGRLAEEIEGATAFVKKLQWDGGEGKEEADPAFGGAGYGRKSRPDLSNTAFMIEALRTVGESENDPAIQRALAFVSRTQNLPGPDNPMPFADKNPDGGFYYTPANGGESQAGTTANGGLRSYASMTYAGLKSMIFAGLGRDDPRVKAAISWLRKNYTFEENPGMGQAGLYYFYHTASKALGVLGDETFTDAEGGEHDWRRELSAAIVARQRADGSWVNTNERWLEGEPVLVTSYALLALANCLE